MLVVAVAIIGSLTALPAMLSYLGQKGWTEKGRVPWSPSAGTPARESRLWGADLTRVLKRPAGVGADRRRAARRLADPGAGDAVQGPGSSTGIRATCRP